MTLRVLPTGPQHLAGSLKSPATVKSASDSCIPEGNPATLHTDSLLAEKPLLRRAQCLLLKPPILSCYNVDPAVQSSWPLPDHCIRLAYVSDCWSCLHFLSRLLVETLWMGRHRIVLQLHGMANEDEMRRMCAAGLYLPPVYCSASGSQEESHLASELQNPAGISVASHRFVSMVFDCPTWMDFYGLWFPSESVPGDRCEHISASTIASATQQGLLEAWAWMATAMPVFSWFSPNRKPHFSHFAQSLLNSVSVN